LIEKKLQSRIDLSNILVIHRIIMKDHLAPPFLGALRTKITTTPYDADFKKF